MKNKPIELAFCAAFLEKEDGSEWDLMINLNQISESSVQEIKSRLSDAFRQGMAFKAQQLRECLEIKEKIKLV